jgi:hypothetical protein
MATEHFNELSEAQAERLAILIEECGEVLHIAGKVLRHGYESCNPYDPKQTSNRELLTREFGDLHAAMVRCLASGDIKFKDFAFYSDAKLADSKFLHHQEKVDG